MIENSPAPMTPPDSDLRDFTYMGLDVVRVRDSGFTAKATGDEFRAGVLLWCASWHQLPAGSLPDDDVELSNLAGYGRVVKEWRRVKVMALHGWVKCADGRLYHETVAEKVNEAWRAKLMGRWRTECARIRKHNDRHRTSLPIPEFDAWMSGGCLTGQALVVASDKAIASDGRPRENGSNREERRGEERRGDSSVVGDADASPPPVKPPENPKEAGKNNDLFPEEQPKGTRWDAEREVPSDWRTDAVAKRREHGLPPVNVDLEAVKFANHWTSKTGRDATKKDWHKTWINWVLGASAPRTGFAPAPVANSPTVSADDEWRRKLQLFKDRKFWKSIDGAPPTEPECSAPLHLLAEFGFRQNPGSAAA